MLEPPRGAPFVDLLVPAGGAPATAIDELQTRLDLVGGGDWRLAADDGTMERSPAPLGPLRGSDDRVWAWSLTPWRPGVPLQSGMSMAIELAITLQARFAAFGVFGTYSWGLVLAEDLHWLHGLVLADWLYNPRLDEFGEVVEEPGDAASEQALLSRKLPVFQTLWTHTRARSFAALLPQGAVQQVEGYLALPLLGPAGDFDPRIWQSFAMQLALGEVRALAGAGRPEGAAAAEQSAPAPSSFFGATPGQSPGQAAPAGFGQAPPIPSAPPGPDDGLTPLARALKEASDAAVLQAEAPEEAPPPEPTAQVARDGSIDFVDGPSGLILRMPAGRYDAGLLRELRKADFGRLPRSERPDGPTAERWIASGAQFLTELRAFSRMFLDNRPLDRRRFEDDGEETPDGVVLACQLPRVAPVLALSLPGEGRRILVCSDRSLAPSTLRGLAPEEPAGGA